MALFTDGSISIIEDLTAQDSQLLEVATVEGIDLTRKLALAQDEVGVEIDNLLGRMSYSTLGGNSQRLGGVVVTPPLKLWHTFRTLEAVYRDAYSNQFNDRYAGKRDEFHRMAKWAYEKLIERGIGICSEPMPQAAAPDLLPVPGSLPAGVYYVSISWVNSMGEEGASSIPTTISVTGGSFQVRPSAAPPRAVGWNVYVGNDPDTLIQQTSAQNRLDIVWLQTGTLVTNGRKAGSGQAATYFQPVPRLIQRG